jgi:prevent-host-death family protein
MTATEAGRSFSSLLNRVAAGETVEVVRNGAPVAVVAPPAVRSVSSARFRDVIATAPPADKDFAVDLERLRKSVGPPQDPWRS